MSTPNPHGRRKAAGGDRRQSAANNDDGDATVTTTQLAGLSRPEPVTPRRITVATPSSRSAARRTPLTGGALTPFGLRAMQRRAAGNTPGRDRRRSGRGMQRETAFDILRNLGKALAPSSQPIRSSPQESQKSSASPERDEMESLDNEPVPERPRLSLPLMEGSGESEDGSPDIPPPRISLPFDEEDITQRSIEYSRRDMAERDRQRLERMSFGGVSRLSEDFGDLTRLDAFSEGGGDITGLQQGDDFALQEGDTTVGQAGFDAGGETEDLRRFSLNFNFPTPVAAGDEGDEGPDLQDDEGFELDPGIAGDDYGFPSSDDGAGGPTLGDFAYGAQFPDQVSEAGTAGVVGGGLRDGHTATGRRQKKLSRHGIPVPLLPSGVVKRLATRFARTSTGAKTKISKDTLAAIEQASEWFFEQASQDLATYAKHAGRKTIDESDVMTLMRRQRLVNSSNTIFSIAQRHLPKELLQDMRLAMPP